MQDRYYQRSLIFDEMSAMLDLKESLCPGNKAIITIIGEAYQADQEKKA